MADLQPINRFAFAQVEKLVSSPEAKPRWAPWAGPVPVGDPKFRFAVFHWNLFHQGWEREEGSEFSDPLEARSRAETLDRELRQSWQLDT